MGKQLWHRHDTEIYIEEKDNNGNVLLHCIVAETKVHPAISPEEAESFANLIVTAVNVMPEVKMVLETLSGLHHENEMSRWMCAYCMADNSEPGFHVAGCLVPVARGLLKELEAVDGD